MAMAMVPGSRLGHRLHNIPVHRIGRYGGRLCVPSPPVCSAAAGDPYSILGVPPDADSGRVEGAYRRKKTQAEKSGDAEALKEIEQAHNEIFMASLNSRLSGKGPVAKQIKNADKTDLFPWRPKISKASDITLKWSAGVYGAILLYNFLLKASPQGVEAAMISGVVLNCWKQYQIFPTDQFGELQKRLEGGWRNLFRGALLTVLATVAGVLVCWSLPDLAAELLQRKLPVAFYESQGALLTLGSLISNFLFTAYVR